MAGQWIIPTFDGQVLAVHAALVRTRLQPLTGEIVYFGGSQYSERKHNAGDLQSTRLFDCYKRTVRKVDSPDKDVFCSGHSLLGDGRLFVAGGTEEYSLQAGTEFHHNHFPGLSETWLFDPGDSSITPWRKVGLMDGGGRWYPGLVTLSDGRAWIMCGHPEKADDSRHSNNTPVIFNPYDPLHRWQVLAAPDELFERKFDADREYPRLHLLPNGLLFCATVLGVLPNRQDFPFNQVINPIDGKRAFVCKAIPDPQFEPPGDPSYLAGDGIFTTTVLLPLLPEDNYRPRVLACGGYKAYVINLAEVSGRSADQFDWNNPAPANLLTQWQETSARAVGGRRFFSNAVILPTGAVFICGGINSPNDGGPYNNSDSVNQAELYEPVRVGMPTSHPADWAWTVLDPAKVVRNYHSVALLMPDGRVWTAGSSTDHDGGKPPETRIEIYEPWYCNVQRPVITHSRLTIDFNIQFSIGIRSEITIARVAVIRAGSVTHSFNADQRYVGLVFNQVSNKELIINAPPDSRIAPPGLYMLFVIDDHGVPSEGQFIYIRSSWFSIGPGETASKDQSVTALWSNNDHLDIFVVRRDGTVLSSYWESSTGWVPWFSISPPGTASPDQSVTALWNPVNGGHLDIFVVRNDGTVLSSYWESAASWVPWFAISPAHTASPDQPVTALWSPDNPGHLDVFVVRTDGTVLSSFWEHGTSWVPWFSIGPADAASPKQGVTALWSPSTPGHLDLFVVRHDGTVLSCYWDTMGSWVPWFSIGPVHTASPNQGVTALWNPANPGHLDIFVVSGNGTVISSYWELGTSWVPWFNISPPHTAGPNDPVTALWSNPNHLDIFAVSDDGKVVSSFWEPAASWVPWFSIGHPSSAKIVPQHLAMLWSRNAPNHLDIFAIGEDGRVWSNWWSDFISGW